MPRVRTTHPSLERELPLVVCGVLLAVVAGYTAYAYREIRSATEFQAFEHLRRVGAQLATSVRLSLERRGGELGRAGSTPAVQEFLEDPDSARAGGAREALGDLVPPVDSVTVAELWTADGSRLLSTAPHLRPDSARVRELIAPAPGDLVRVGPFYRDGDSTYYWAAVPVRLGERTLGYVVERRKLVGDSTDERRARDVIGSDVRVYFAGEREDAPYFNAMTGAPIPRPSSPAALEDAPDLLSYERAGEGTVVARRERIRPGLALVVERPYATVLDRPRAFAARTGRIALLLLLLGTVAAWVLSRRLARPIVELDAAAEGLRGGDYTRRVHTRRRDEVGRLATTFNAMADSIERSRAELEGQVEESRELARRLEQANRAKSDFLAVMSHELRTPLNAIAGYVEILQMGIQGPLTDEQRESLERVRRNQRHLLGVITGILDFARVDARQMPYDRRAVSLEEAIRDAERMLAQQIGTKGLRYRRAVDVEPDLFVWADPARLQQVLINLWSNAIRFTPVGGEIWVTLDATSELVRLRIHDTGVGIPAGKLEAIFEPFVQARGGLTRPADGTGLGLTISREFARAMGGDLIAESEEGEGATFTLTLPRAAPPARELAS